MVQTMAKKMVTGQDIILPVPKDGKKHGKFQDDKIYGDPSMLFTLTCLLKSIVNKG